MRSRLSRAHSIQNANQNLVIVIDDDASMLRSATTAATCYASLLFPSADAFVKHTDFDGVACILLDINLGDVSGIELRLRPGRLAIQCRYMTGNDNLATRDSALQSGWPSAPCLRLR
jgi:FixJ family two-component response regulator